MNQTSALLVSGRRGASREELSPFQVPINVAVEEPRARIVSEESDRDLIARAADAHDVTFNGVDVVIS
jgi:hypothetical protein